MKPTLLTFDIFGTVLDWRTGLTRAVAERQGAPLEPGQFDRIVDVQGELERSAPFRTYREITAISLERVLGLPPLEADAVGQHVGAWPLYADSTEGLRRLMRLVPCVALTNSDRTHGAQVQAQLGFALSHWICAEETRVYKPSPQFWQLASSALGYPWAAPGGTSRRTPTTTSASPGSSV